MEAQFGSAVLAVLYDQVQIQTGLSIQLLVLNSQLPIEFPLRTFVMQIGVIHYPPFSVRRRRLRHLHSWSWHPMHRLVKLATFEGQGSRPSSQPSVRVVDRVSRQPQHPWNHPRQLHRLHQESNRQNTLHSLAFWDDGVSASFKFPIIVSNPETTELIYPLS